MIDRKYAMKKGVLKIIIIINIVVLGITTSNVFAGDITNENLVNDDGIALIAEGKGEFSCNNDKQLKNVNIFVLLSETTRLGLDIGPSGLGLKSTENNENIAVKINNGTVSSDGFQMQGTLQVDDFCEMESSVTFSVNGTCGINKIITVKSSDGGFGMFESNVSCSPHN